jgi:hypothetical protein
VLTHVGTANPRAQAVALGDLNTRATARGALASGQSSWYSFSLDAPETISYSLGNDDGDANIYLYDGAGTPLGASSWSGLISDIGKFDLFSGSYFLEVKGVDAAHYNLNVGINHAPLITATAPAVGEAGSSISLADLFSVVDPDGDQLSSGYFRDTTIGGGYLTYQGVKVEEDQSYPMFPNDLKGYTWVFGSEPGTEYLEVTQYDQYGSKGKGYVGFTTSAAWADQTGIGADGGAGTSFLAQNPSLQQGLLASA